MSETIPFIAFTLIWSLFQRFILFFVANRNFDMLVRLNPSAVGGETLPEYSFSAIDRAEYPSLFDFLTVRRVNVIEPEVCLSLVKFAAYRLLLTLSRSIPLSGCHGCASLFLYPSLYPSDCQKS